MARCEAIGCENSDNLHRIPGGKKTSNVTVTDRDNNTDTPLKPPRKEKSRDMQKKKQTHK